MHRAMLLCAVLLALPLAGCGHRSTIVIGGPGPHVGESRGGHGPPAHAPAHGHRRHHEHRGGNAEIVFDSQLGVYVVVDVPNTYYWNGTYLRIEDGRWMASAALDRGWAPRASDSLPPGLRKKHVKHGKHRKDGKYAKDGKDGRHPGKGRGPAKGRW